MTDKVKMVCACCGSEHLLVDAYVEWNAETQAWEATEIFENSAYCSKCDDETRIEERTADS
jgi:hypothetical protein